MADWQNCVLRMHARWALAVLSPGDYSRQLCSHTSSAWNTVPHTVYRGHLLSVFPQEPSLVSRVFPISPRPALSPWGVNAMVFLRWCTPLPYAFLQRLDPFVRYADQGCFGGKGHIPLRRAQGKGSETLMELLAGKGSQTSQKWKPHLPFLVISACKALTIPALTNHTMAAWIPLSWQLVSTCPRGSLWSWSCKRFLVNQEIHCCRSGISHLLSIGSSKAVWGSQYSLSWGEGTFSRRAVWMGQKRRHTQYIPFAVLCMRCLVLARWPLLDIHKG